MNSQISDVICSVLLVTYNHELFIREAIEGVLKQRTSFSLELVIGEDHSTDKTRDICQEYASKFPNIVRLCPDTGNLGLNRNFIRTLGECRGKYIAHLEGDDKWITFDKLQRQIDILEKQDDISLVHTNCSTYDYYTKKSKHMSIKFNGVCPREVSFGLQNIVSSFYGQVRFIRLSTCCYRRNLLEDILNEDPLLFTSPDFPINDVQIFREMSIRGRFAFIDEDTTEVALHDSLSAPYDVHKEVKFRLGSFKLGLYYIDKYKLPQEVIKYFCKRELYYFLKYGLKYGNKSLVAYCVGEARLRKYRLSLTQMLKYLTIKVIH